MRPPGLTRKPSDLGGAWLVPARHGMAGQGMAWQAWTRNGAEVSPRVPVRLPRPLRLPYRRRGHLALDLQIDAGFRVSLFQRVRLSVIDAPERGKPGYREASLFLADWARERGPWLRLRTYNEDNFGRWIGDLYDKRTGATASEALLHAGLGTVWE